MSSRRHHTGTAATTARKRLANVSRTSQLRCRRRQELPATSCQPKSCAHERTRQWVSQAASIAADAGHHG